MKWIILIIFLVISCPRPGVREIRAHDYLAEARRTYEHDPVYAYSLLHDSVSTDKHDLTHAEVLVKMYIHQCEYERAAALLDSIEWSIPLTTYEENITLLKNKRWKTLIETTDDALLKGMAYYQLHDYPQAVAFLSQAVPPHDYRQIYLVRAYEAMEDYESALNTLFNIDSVSSYFYPEYQDLLFALFSHYDDFATILKELQELKKPHLREFVRLQVYEKQKDTKNMTKCAWNLIRHYPKSEGAYYACQFVTPKNKTDHKALGKVYYYHDDYDDALQYLQKATQDNAVSYYIGRIYYRWKNYTSALRYFSSSTWSAAYYYRGRAYENMGNTDRAIAMYDSLYSLRKNSKYATRGLKRKAFLLEDIGDTLRAVETFLKINNKNTKFRAGMQLFRLGKLGNADTVFRISNEPEFVYWRAKITEKQGNAADSLKTILTTEYPLSYYTLVRNNSAIVFDTTALDVWMLQFGDSIASFSARDSAHLSNAARYFSINETEYAVAELDLISEKSARDLLFLSKLCAQYGANKESILYSLEIKKMAEKNGIHTIPRALFSLLYPTRYLFRITDQNMDASLCLAMIWQESLFDPDAQSPADARGLMQIVPATGAKIAKDLNVTSYSLYDPVTSVQFGTYYFLNLQKEFESVPLSLAGYNAGPVRVRQWVAQNPRYEIDEFIDLIPYDETRNYVKEVLSRQIIYETLFEK